MENDFEELRARRRMPYVSALTLKTAQKMINASIKESDKYGIPVSIAVSDAGGYLLAFGRQENAMLCSVQIALNIFIVQRISKANLTTVMRGVKWYYMVILIGVLLVALIPAISMWLPSQM